MSNPIHPYAVYTSSEAASLLKVDVITIQRYIRNHKLVATKLGKIYRITGESILNLMSLDTTSVATIQDRVKRQEEATFIKSKSFLSSNEKGSEYLRVFDLVANGLMLALQPVNSDNEDELIIKYIGSRIFNSSMAAYRDALSGYYQVSFSNQRDLIEIQFLLDFFRTDRNQIQEWKKADNKVRIEKYSPGELRKLLDKRDGFLDRKRDQRYKMFCEYATHVSYPGFKLLANQDNLIEIGSFYDESKLINCLHELCLNLGYVVISLLAVVTISNAQTAKYLFNMTDEFDKLFGFKITEGEKYKEEKEKLDKTIKTLLELQEKRTTFK